MENTNKILPEIFENPFKGLIDDARDLKRRSLPMFVIIIMYILYCFPYTFLQIAEGIDTSWIFFLDHMVEHREYVFGENIFFTYGPLGFTCFIENIGRSFGLSVFFQCLLHFMFIRGIFMVSRYVQINKLQLVSAAAGVFLIACTELFTISHPQLDMLWLLTAYLYFICAAKGDKKAYFPFTVCAAIMFFIKFSSLFTIIASLAVYTVFMLIGKYSLKKTAVFWLFVPVSIVAYLIYNPSLKGLYMYFYGAMQISGGYNLGNSTDSASAAMLFWVILGVIACLILLVCMLLKKENYSDAAIMGAIFTAFFFFYKWGFVRHNEDLAFACIIAAVSIMLISFDISVIYARIGEGRPKKAACFSVMLTLFICMGFSAKNYSYMFTKIYDKVVCLPKSAEAVVCDSGQQAVKLSEDMKSIIGGRSVMSFPHELSYLNDESIDFRVMPIFQNYCAYTPWCDAQNADFISSSETAPDFVLFTFDTIDDRYPLIETPRTWNAIKDNYVCVLEEEGKYLLKRVSTPAPSRSYELISAQTITNEMLEIRGGGYYTFDVPCDVTHFSVTADEGLEGTAVKFFWKIPPVFLKYGSFNGRILPENMDIPISLSDIGVYGDYSFAASDSSSGNSGKMTLCGTGVKYYSRIMIKFYRSTCDGLPSAAELPADNITIDKAEYSDGVFSIRGWTFDRKTCLPYDRMYMSVGGKIFRADYGKLRYDVCSYFGIKGAERCGFELNVKEELTPEELDNAEIILENSEGFRSIRLGSLYDIEKGIPIEKQSGED